MAENGLKQELRTSWHALMATYGVERSVGEALLEDLFSAYSGNGRYYHDLTHIHRLLSTLEHLGDLAKDIDAIKLAVWYHDVVYDLDAADNERRSAEHAARKLGDTTIPAEVVAHVQNMIQATNVALEAPNHIDAKILVDVDLASLASGEEEYDRNCRRIRQEYAAVPEEEYRRGRKEILRMFLRRERIFLTKRMFERYESKARQNIEREIASLS